MNPVQGLVHQWQHHLALGLACVAGCWMGAALDQLHPGGGLWRSLCLSPGWPGFSQLGMRVQLMPAAFAGTLSVPVVVWWLAIPQRPWLPLLLCLVSALVALPVAITLCRLTTQAGLPWNQTLAGMLALESTLLLSLHTGLCLLAFFLLQARRKHLHPVSSVRRPSDEQAIPPRHWSPPF